MQVTSKPGTTVRPRNLIEIDIESAIRWDVNVLISGGDDRTRLSLAYSLYQRTRRRGDVFMFVDRQRTAPLCEGESLPAGGILLIEELGVLSLEMQIELIRLLDRRDAQWAVRPLEPPPLRVIAMTNDNLLRRIASQEFLGDLFYRLNTINIVLPTRHARPVVSGTTALATHVM